MTVNTAEAGTNIGMGPIAEEDFTTEPMAQPTGSGASETSVDRYYREQAQADQAALYSSVSAKQTETGGLTFSPTGSEIGDKIVQAAEHYLDTPYLWGGTGAGGVDCSGLVLAAYKAAGINLPRISYEQANSGQRTDLKSLRPGDLVAWDNSDRNPGADHIAIYIGNGQIIEAPHPGSRVRIRSLGKNESAWGVRMGWS